MGVNTKNKKMVEQQNYASIEMFLGEFNVKLRDLEEKQNLIKDRIILIGENLISEKEETEKEILKLNLQIKEMDADMKKLKLAIQRIIDSQEEYARKSELQILERQFQMFQPLEFARISDVEEIVKKIIKEKKQEA